jgi:hypothetical protein
MSSLKLSKSTNSWDKAITDAKIAIDRLQTAIGIFEKKKAAGERWPEAKKAAARN